MGDALKPVDQWDFITSETKYVLHENLRTVVTQANASGLPFRLFRKLAPNQRFVETVVLADVAFQSDGSSVRQGVWDERKLIITGDGVFGLDGEEAS